MRGGRPLVISDPTLLVRRANERLVMQRDRTVVASMPIRELSHVAVHGPVTMTGAAIAGILDAGVDVTLHSSGGKWRGTISSAASGNVYLLLAQADAWRQAERRTVFARALVAGKIAGARQVVHRHARDRDSIRCDEAAKRMGQLEDGVAAEKDVDGVRGIEGVAAAVYFDVFGEMLSGGWRFPGRVRRPATDPVNALLGFGYTLATGEVAQALMLRGFDTRIGLVHGLRYGRESLALDLVEEFRAPMVDRFTLRLLNRGQLKADDFQTQEDGAVRMTQEARRRYLALWEELLGSKAGALANEGPLSGEDLVETQRVKRPTDEGDPEVEAAATWRGRIERQVMRLHRFLMKNEAYVPMTATRRTETTAERPKRKR